MMRAIVALKRVRQAATARATSEGGPAVARKGSVGGPGMFEGGERARRASLGSIGAPTARGSVSNTLGVYQGFRGT